MLAARDLDGVAAVGRLEHLEVLALEEELHQHARDRLVVGDEHALPLARRGVGAVGVVGQHAIHFFDRRHPAATSCSA